MTKTINQSSNQSSSQSFDQKPLVSCVIIFWNAKKENFFEEAIESILAQTYDNWELILADDGSTDESTAIAQHYAQQYPDRIFYVEHNGHKNRGMSATRNLGIRHSRGEYIAFLDSDDVWLPHKLEEQVPLLETHPEAAMLYGRTQYWFSWMENNPCIWQLNPDEELGDFLTLTSKQFDTLVEPPEQIVLFLENRHIYPCTCSILIRRTTFDEFGGFEENFRNALEDIVFHSKVFLKRPVYVSSQCWDRYRYHPESYWRTAVKQKEGEKIHHTARLNYLLWLKSYLHEQNIQYPKVWRALKKELWAHQHPTLHRQLERIRHPVQTTKNLLKKVEKRLVPLAKARQVSSLANFQPTKE